MGRFKDGNRNNPIEDWLMGQEFEKTDGTYYDNGFSKTYKVGTGYTWVIIILDDSDRKINVYREDSMGFCLGEHEVKIEDCWMNELESFINNVDKELEVWIG